MKNNVLLPSGSKLTLGPVSKVNHVMTNVLKGTLNTFM